jgi:hypothetical protein
MLFDLDELTLLGMLVYLIRLICIDRFRVFFFEALSRLFNFQIVLCF